MADNPTLHRFLQPLLWVTLVPVICAAWILRPAESGDPPLRVAKGDHSVTVLSGDRPLLEYRFLESPLKPYVRKLFSPAGIQILRDSPKDHQHHHALMFALAADKVDFWAEAEGSGREQHRTIEVANPRKQNEWSRAGFKQQLEWTDVRTNKVLLIEQRAVEAYQARDIAATLLTWCSGLETPPGKDSTLLTGSHYFGLGMRFVESMDSGGRFINSERLEGEPVRGSERLTPAKWCAYTASADGKRVTVALFDHPANPRHPARMFTMAPPFAYLAATLNLWKEPMTLQRGRPLNLLYGVAVWDGETDAAQVDSLYQRWAANAAGGPKE